MVEITNGAVYDKECWRCLNGVAHSTCVDDNGYVISYESNMLSRNEELSNRMSELEAQVVEIWDRMKQYENVLSTAFRLATTGDLKKS